MATKVLPQLTREFVREHASSNLLIIHNLIFDLTYFIEHHPGGDTILQEYFGLDATEAFESVGHSEHARTMMLKFVVGAVRQDQHVAHSANPWNLPLDTTPFRQIVA